MSNPWLWLALLVTGIAWFLIFGVTHTSIGLY